MKYLVASDIHGSLYYTKKLVEVIEKEKPDTIILLGDLYYHGPRNSLSMEYNPMEVSKVFNGLKDKLKVIKGNCDAEVDEMISEFSFVEHIREKIGNKRFYFTHGHRHNLDNIPNNVDVLVYGHFHTGFIKQQGETICVNAGSVSLPKNDTPNSYLIINEKEIILKDLDDNIINAIEYC